MKPVDLGAIRRVVPELIEDLQARVRILQRVKLLQPIGRRGLAVQMGLTERVLRSEVDVLRQQGLLEFASAGMSVSDEGERLLEQLDIALASLDGRDALSGALSRILEIPHVVVVPGDSDEENWVKQTLGYQASQELAARLSRTDVLAVTGGTTMAATAKMMPQHEFPSVKVVPARGGLGENVSLQSNTIASELAKQLGGTSIMLHVPDQLSQDTFHRLVQEPHIQQRLSEVRDATFVLHGIGDAMKMAKRRQMDDSEVEVLNTSGAVAEAFGYYFNAYGETVYSMTTVGLRLADINHIRVIMAVAGGHSKARAMAAAAKAYRIDVLVTDEGAAKQIIQHYGGDEQ
ncbi:sugar-binding transcriptional regulator [Alicyclobacillus sp. SO9]|uniref:sugar-binding transcriptional regulator n=1 Tax=Alicyclobacillus sp. SO9 TaxID=2665646 RepID=UPI0018E7DB80|nr:sugar-binding domain-containing protein [Alicyclobacillus sp. SO9]QQE79982.1 DNA-binding transcriptional regulator [Alicyclobacillus sp. SO9]